MRRGVKIFNSGFSLLEIAIVLLIISLVAGASFGLIPKKDYDAAEKITKQNLDKIEKALLAFYNTNGYLPCPASLTVTGTSIGTETSCFGAPPAGTTDFTPGIFSTQSRSGTVPIRSLSLAPEVILDGWGNRINYTVPVYLTSSYFFFDAVNTAGAVVVVDAGGNVMNNTNVAYFLSAPGANHRGAYSLAGAQVLACSGGSDSENCDGDEFFMYRSTNLAGTTPDYDDYVKWKTVKEVRKYGNFLGAGGGATIQYAKWTNQGPTGAAAAGWGTGPTYGYAQLFNSTSASYIAPSTFRLPEGKFVIKGTVTGCDVDLMQAMFWDPNIFLGFGFGIPQEATAATTQCNRVVVQAYREVPVGSTADMMLYPYFTTPNAVDGLGRNTGIGYPYIYSEVEVWQIRNE